MINTIYFSDNLKNYLEEEKYIDKTLDNHEYSEKNIGYINIAGNIIKDKEVEEREEKRKEILINKLNKLNKLKEKKITFGFIPSIFIKEQNGNKNLISGVLNNNIFSNFIDEIDVLFYENRKDVRGKMKNKKVNLFGPQDMEDDELVSIFIHEFSHYIDIYNFDKNDKKDVSDVFYDISWDSVKTIKKGLKLEDFVSGYSMTNKYEDFAESLTYYILHNDDFLIKSKKSNILLKKYNFFSFYLFKGDIFKDTDFSEGNKIENYYRDITKIDFSRKNFLQYLEKGI